MKRVLLVSPYPYTPTNRGMDLLTLAFENAGWETHHLIFPNVFYTVKKKKTFQTQVVELKAKKTLIPYVDSLMKRLPSWVFQWILQHHKKAVRHINFAQYDAVVLESGKPLFLQDLIPAGCQKIYRQSDSVRLVLGKNPDYIALEDKMIAQSDHVLVVKERFRDSIPQVHQDKVHLIINGFSFPANHDYPNPYPPGSKNAIYVGLTDLDAECILETCKKNPDITFHFFGAGLKRIKRQIKGLPNLMNHGFTSMAEHLPYLTHATLYVFPFQRNELMSLVGLTSKFYMAMRCQLPIVCYRMEPAEEFKNLPVDFCDSPQEFAETVFQVAQKPTPREYPLPWKKLSRESRLKEYTDFIHLL
ncbi:MAG: glycosyltransferase [Spirochaetales bacterium]|nr:glycosyltransferase [Spirochaetales bacterium]